MFHGDNEFCVFSTFSTHWQYANAIIMVTSATAFIPQVSSYHNITVMEGSANLSAL
jgi:hypothetical protein